MASGISVIVKYLKSFVASLHLTYTLLVMTMTGIFIFLNYHYRFERGFLAGQPSFARKFIGYYLLYFIPFVAAYFLQRIIPGNKAASKSKLFLLLLILAPAVFALRVSYTGSESVVNLFWQGDEAVFWYDCINWILRAVFTIFLIYCIWQAFDKSNSNFYGTAATGNLKPYFIMVLCMVPLLALAATQKDFLAMYPRVQAIQGLSLNNKPLHYIIYELSYGFDFISIEFFFRGFLILAFSKFAGTQAILPAACFYCTIHFGKPAGEAVSSFFGGTLLGVISYHSKSIWGGLVVHLGIAWLMEIAGLTGHLF
jgi:hypothetical protein